MNDEFASLEDELRRLQPRAPGKHLEERIDKLLAKSSVWREPTAWWQRLGFNRPFAALGWGVLSPALTAALVFVAVHLADVKQPPFPPGRQASTKTGEAAIGHPDSSATGFAPASSPVSARATNVLYQALDEGVVLDGGQEPVHRVRYRSADLVEWRNPGTGANWQVSYPREDVVLVPIRAE